MKYFALFLAFAFSISSCSTKPITASDAANNIDKKKTVCGEVMSSFLDQKASGKPLFINMGAAYPNQLFTIVIFESDRKKYDFSLEDLKGKTICVTGTITKYNDKPQIKVEEAGMIKVK